MLYFDHNSTTPVDAKVAAVMSRAMAEVFGNPSSVHRAGQTARHELEQARRGVARCLNASAAEIVFTSGGTESNNLAIFGVVRAAGAAAKHLITSAIEHPAVLEPCRQCERDGVEFSYIRVGRDGTVNPADIERAMRPETVLVSLMHANNETGVIQPVADVANMVKQRRRAGQSIWLHCDGVQAAGKIVVNVDELGVDLYSVSGHKMYAPKGCGALYVRKDTPVASLQFGGRHERGRRAGTENVPGAMAMALAMQLCSDDEHLRIRELRDLFETELRQSVADFQVNGAGPRLGNTSNIAFQGVAAEALVIALDLRGMAVSTGSACSSGSVEPSHVLRAMGLTEEEAKASVRFSFGRGNCVDDIQQLVSALAQILMKMRKPALLVH